MRCAMTIGEALILRPSLLPWTCCLLGAKHFVESSSEHNQKRPWHICKSQQETHESVIRLTKVKNKRSDIFLFNINNGNTRTMCEICFMSAIKKPEGHHWCRPGILNVNLNRFHTLFWCFRFWLSTKKCCLGKVLDQRNNCSHTWT